GRRRDGAFVAISILRLQFQSPMSMLKRLRDLWMLPQRLERLEAAHRQAAEQAHRADRTATQMKLLALLDREQQQGVEQLPALFDTRRIAEHLRHAVASAPLLADPFPHAIV